MFRIEWRYVLNDAVVSPWKDVNLKWTDSAVDAYAELCAWLGCVPDRVGFTDAPELGQIRTGSGYGDYSLFQHPESDRYQYRIVELGHTEPEPEPEPERQITLPISSKETPH